MNVTLDGFIAGPNAELDWHFETWNEEMANHAWEQLSRTDTILLGRVTYEALASYWPQEAAGLDCAREDIAYADMMNNYTKIVFSRTLDKAEWNNTRLIKKNIKEEIVSLKKQPGKDIIVFGSGKVAAALIQWGLVDEYQIWVHPVILGKGKPLFKGLPHRLTMNLYKTKIFRSGVVILYYSPHVT